MVTNNDIVAKLEEVVKGLNLLQSDMSILKKEVANNKEEIMKAIQSSQEDTIDSLKEVINEGYAMNDERLVRIENNLDLGPLKH